MLYDEQEIQDRKKKSGVALLLILIILVLAFMTMYLYIQFRPLPQTDACELAGYEAGKVFNDMEFCYSDCEGNTIDECGFRSVVI